MYGYGFGFRGASPPWPYTGRGRGGLPRCWYPAAPAYTPGFYRGYPAPPPVPYPRMTPGQERDTLKKEAEAVKRQLENVEVRVKELEHSAE